MSERIGMNEIGKRSGPAAAEDRAAIREVLQNWIFCRDNGEWEALRKLFATEGRMTTNVASMSADEFVRYATAQRARGSLAHHLLGASRVRLNGDRAFVESQAQLISRGVVRGVTVDVSVLVRYLDRFIREEGAWRILDRRPIYIRDRMDPVVPGTVIPIDEALLAEGPEGCRYMVYMQRSNGAAFNPIIRPTFNTPFAAELFAECETWLER